MKVFLASAAAAASHRSTSHHLSQLSHTLSSGVAGTLGLSEGNSDAITKAGGLKVYLEMSFLSGSPGA